MSFSFPLALLLVPYAGICAYVAFVGFINLRNLARYGGRDATYAIISALYVTGIATILFFTWTTLTVIDWSADIPVGGIAIGL